ncbi:hypothetical protein AK973_3971 [Pseudomonas brassicacearum]|nr:hypothetical protein AK973_3971 [Pseudomonas brassicacearum]
MWEQGLPAMNENAVQRLDRGAAIAGKPCSHSGGKSLCNKSGAFFLSSQEQQ